MNLSSLKPSEEASETMNNRHTEDSVIHSLHDEVLLMLFNYLPEDQLLIVEQVCVRWKALVNTCFATKRSLEMWSHLGLSGLRRMTRYGPSLKSLLLYDCNDIDYLIDWIAEIGDAFPNLLSLTLVRMCIEKESLRVLPMKCCRITSISLCVRYLSDADIGNVLKGFPGLKCLDLGDYQNLFGYITTIGKCFRELGPNVEHLKLKTYRISPAGTRHIFSRCTNLQTLTIDGGFKCGTRSFSEFCEKSPLRELDMDGLCDIPVKFPKKAFLAISLLSLLEKLYLCGCEKVDSDVLIRISRGCPNLKYVGLFDLPRVCDRGLKALAQCRRLTDLDCWSLKVVSDESLFEFAKVGLLEALTITVDKFADYTSTITDNGLSAIITQCPNLRYLTVDGSIGVGDRTVDAAIQAVESRQRLSATDDQSPRGKRNAIVPRSKSIKDSGYLLRIYMSGAKGLNRYKDGLSHQLLYLYVR